MRALDETSGPWVGWSIQLPRKIHERFILQVGGGKIEGTGEDADGDFVISGDYEMGGAVAIVRRYTYSTHGQGDNGGPTIYRGQWDGSAISGDWRYIFGYDNGVFEMWPEDETGEIAFEELRQTEPAGR